MRAQHGGGGPGRCPDVVPAITRRESQDLVLPSYFQLEERKGRIPSRARAVLGLKERRPKDRGQEERQISEASFHHQERGYTRLRARRNGRAACRAHSAFSQPHPGWRAAPNRWRAPGWRSRWKRAAKHETANQGQVVSPSRSDAVWWQPASEANSLSRGLSGYRRAGILIVERVAWIPEHCRWYRRGLLAIQRSAKVDPR